MAALTAGVVLAALLGFLLLGAGVSRGSAVDNFQPPDFLLSTRIPVNIFCKENPDLYVAISGDKVVLAKPDENDKTQVWYVHIIFDGKQTGDDGRGTFTITSPCIELHAPNQFTQKPKMTGKDGQFTYTSTPCTSKAMVNKNEPRADGLVPVQLADYNPAGKIDELMQWTAGDDLGDGYREVRTARVANQTLNGLFGNVHDGTVVGIYRSSPSAGNAVWKFSPVKVH